jgi:hypothetical protein
VEGEYGDWSQEGRWVESVGSIGKVSTGKKVSTASPDNSSRNYSSSVLVKQALHKILNPQAGQNCEIR